MAFLRILLYLYRYYIKRILISLNQFLGLDLLDKKSPIQL